MQKILVVEDEKDFQSLLELTLKKAGYEVRIAPNGEEALKAFHEQRPNLILLDIRLPDMDGFEVFKRLKGDKESLGVPVIVLTVQSAVTVVLQGLRLGAQDYMIKPFNPEELLERISSLLRNPK